MAVSTSASSTFGQAVRKTLVENSAVSTLVSGRVRDLAALDPDAATQTYPCVVVNFRGGRANYPGVYQESVFELWTLSRTSPGEALDVYDACFGALQAERLAHGGSLRAVVCQETSRPEQGWLEETRAWFARGRWVARSAN